MARSGVPHEDAQRASREMRQRLAIVAFASALMLAAFANA